MQSHRWLYGVDSNAFFSFSRVVGTHYNSSTTDSSSIPVYWQKSSIQGAAVYQYNYNPAHGFVASMTTLLVSFSRAVATHQNITVLLAAVIFQYTGSNTRIMSSHRWVCGVDDNAASLLQSRSGHLSTAAQARQLILVYPTKINGNKKRNNGEKTKQERWSTLLLLFSYNSSLKKPWSQDRLQSNM